MFRRPSALLPIWIFVGLVVSSGVSRSQSNWPPEGLVLSTEQADFNRRNTALDGAGGVFVSWIDFEADFDIVLRVQRVDANGNALWAPGGVAVAQAVFPTTNLSGAALAPDGAGGVFVAWYRDDTVNSIRVQRLSAGGVPLFPGGPTTVSSPLVSDIRSRVAIAAYGASDAAVAYLALAPFQALVVQTIDGTGNITGGDGVGLDALIGASQIIGDVELAVEGNDLYAATTATYASGFESQIDVVLGRFDLTQPLASQAMNNSVRVLFPNIPTDEISPRLFADGRGGVYLTRIRLFGPDRRLIADAFGPDLARRNGSWFERFVLTNSPSDPTMTPSSEAYDAAVDPTTGDLVIVHAVQRRDVNLVPTGTFDAYVQRLDYDDSSRVLPINGVQVFDGSFGESEQTDLAPQLALDAQGNALIVDVEPIFVGDGGNILRAQKIDTLTGARLWGATGVRPPSVADARHTYLGRPRVGDDDELFFAYLTSSNLAQDNDVRLQRLDGQTGAPGIVSASSVVAGDLAGDGSGALAITWDASSLDPPGSGDVDLYSVWRGVLPARDTVPLVDPSIVTPGFTGPARIEIDGVQYDYQGQVGAIGAADYTFEVASLGNGVPTSILVITHDVDEAIYWDAAPVVGVAEQDDATSVEPGAGVSTLALFGNAPNPFSGTTQIRFSLPRSARVRVELFDLRGRRVQSQTRDLSAGHHVLPLDGRDDDGRALAAGVYMLRLAAGGQVDVKRVSIVR